MPALLRKNTRKRLRANGRQATNATLGGKEVPGAESDSDRVYRIRCETEKVPRNLVQQKWAERALWFARAEAYLRRRNFLRRRPLEMGLSQSIHAITQG